MAWHQIIDSSKVRILCLVENKCYGKGGKIFLIFLLRGIERGRNYMYVDNIPSHPLFLNKDKCGVFSFS